MKKSVFCCLASLLCWSAVAVRAAKVDTVEVHSRKMGRAVRTIVISPEKTEGKGAAVVYLLHGYGGNETTWPGLKPELKDYADRENLIFVCPNGENSWYWDSPLNEDSQFETFVSRELVSYVDGHYRTLPSREKRAITGLSMGGHGALWLAIRHQDVFGAAGSTSGGLDIRPFPDNWDMKEQIGAKDAVYACIRQVSFGLLDMAYYTLDHPFKGDVMAFEREAWKRTVLLPQEPDTCMSVQFGHIMSGGYAAGYYSYKWAEVLDADAFSLFKQHGIFSREIATRFRKEILSKGGTEHPMTLYRRFRGQDPSIDALLERNGIKKQS